MKKKSISLSINPAAHLPKKTPTVFQTFVYAATALSSEGEQLFLTFHKTTKGAVKQHVEFAANSGFIPEKKAKELLETLEQEKHGKNTPTVVLEMLLNITGYEGYVFEFPLND